MKISQRIQAIHGSGTAKILNQMEHAAQTGRTVINLAVGEPGFETPLPILSATKAALDRHRTRYTATTGILGLKQALAERLGDYAPDEVIVTNGAKQALYAAFQVILDTGDEVILPTPCWVSFTHQIRLAGGVPVQVPTVRHQLDVAAIREAVTPKTRAILLNSPNNPTGAVYPDRDLRRIAELALERNLYIVTDETYDRLVYDGARKIEGLRKNMLGNQLVRIRSFSKEYAMTGFRVGYAVGPKAVVNAMEKLQSHLCGNVCTFAQYGALAALSLAPSVLERHRLELEENRNIAFDFAVKWFECIKPEGAFYLFPDVTGRLKKGESSRDLALRLFREADVAVVPGEDFGLGGHLRISFALSRARLIEGFERIERIL